RTRNSWPKAASTLTCTTASLKRPRDPRKRGAAAIWTVWKIRLRRAEAKRTAPAFQAIPLKSGSCFPFRRAWFALEAGLLPPGPPNDRHCSRSPRPSLPGFVKSVPASPGRISFGASPSHRTVPHEHPCPCP
ncbi:Manganese transport regulator MntR, partial [Dysosmobacter welbionis]